MRCIEPPQRTQQAKPVVATEGVETPVDGIPGRRTSVLRRRARLSVLAPAVGAYRIQEQGVQLGTARTSKAQQGPCLRIPDCGGVAPGRDAA